MDLEGYGDTKTNLGFPLIRTSAIGVLPQTPIVKPQSGVDFFLAEYRASYLNGKLIENAIFLDDNPERLKKHLQQGYEVLNGIDSPALLPDVEFWKNILQGFLLEDEQELIYEFTNMARAHEEVHRITDIRFGFSSCLDRWNKEAAILAGGINKARIMRNDKLVDLKQRKLEEGGKQALRLYSANEAISILYTLPVLHSLSLYIPQFLYLLGKDLTNFERPLTFLTKVSKAQPYLLALTALLTSDARILNGYYEAGIEDKVLWGLACLRDGMEEFMLAHRMNREFCIGLDNEMNSAIDNLSKLTGYNRIKRLMEVGAGRILING